MAEVPAVEIVFWVATNSDGWTAVSHTDARDAVERLVDKHGHGVGIRTTQVNLLIEVPRPRQIGGHIPEGDAEVVLPLSAIKKLTGS